MHFFFFNTDAYYSCLLIFLFYDSAFQPTGLAKGGVGKESSITEEEMEPPADGEMRLGELEISFHSETFSRGLKPLSNCVTHLLHNCTTRHVLCSDYVRISGGFSI